MLLLPLARWWPPLLLPVSQVLTILNILQSAKAQSLWNLYVTLPVQGRCARRAVGKHALLIFNGLCSVVQAGRRWCLSWTPIQNSVEDLYSCFRFLRYNPYCKKAAFKTMLKDPLQDHPAKGAQLLQICLKVCQPVHFIHLLLNPSCC